MTFDFLHQPGPCVICGDTNYSLSCGGPSICPKCDCGNFDAATVQKQAKVISALRQEIESLRAQPRLFTGCLRDGVCRGVCKTTDCPNYDLVVAARLVVEKQVEGIVYPRRCQKCGSPTKGEEAYVDGQFWCHPCADTESPLPAARPMGQS